MSYINSSPEVTLYCCEFALYMVWVQLDCTAKLAFADYMYSLATHGMHKLQHRHLNAVSFPRHIVTCVNVLHFRGTAKPKIEPKRELSKTPN